MDVLDLASILNTIDANPSDEEFQNCVDKSVTVAAFLDDDQKLCLYALYKQSTEGDAPCECKSKSPVDLATWFDCDYTS